MSGGRDADEPGRPGAAEAGAQALLAGEAWEAYCDALRDAGRHLLGENRHADPGTRGEAFEYLLGLVVAGARQALELSDPARPRLLRNPESASRWGAENADNQYLWTRVAPEGRYRIHGTRGSAFDFLVEVKEGYMQLGAPRNFATLSARELDCAPDGRFELWLGGAPRARNWLPLDPDARYVAIRQYLCDWDREAPARFEIERLDAPAGPPPRPTPAAIAAQLASAGRWTRDTARFWTGWVRDLRAAHRPDEVAPARQIPGGADAICYGNDLYRLAPGEALVLTTAPPRARYWQVQLCDLWFRSQEWSARCTSLNQAQARLDADGLLRVVVAHEDPGVPNWLDAAGREEGLLQYRWVWTEDNPRPRIARVPLAALRDALPADTPRVSPQAREAQRRARERHRSRREPES